VDNTVTVTLCSDVSFDGCEGYSSVDGYYKTVRFNDVYTLSEATAEGYIWFGWWLETDGAWSRITDVKTLDGTKIQAAWISQVSVEITEAKANGSFLKTWTIGGTYSGGLPYGATSKEIFDSLNITASVSVLYRLSKDGSTVYDTLSGGKEQSAEQNAFKQSEMTSFYGLVGVKYAGATVSITYTYGDLTATTSATSWKSV
jgi:hypothetical protein